MDELQVMYKDVCGFPDYMVGDDGTVLSKARNTQRQPEVDGWHKVRGSLDKDGYTKIILCEGKIRKYVRLHVLVLSAFVGGPPDGMTHPTVAHCNGDRSDNRLSNLRWASQRDNISDKRLHGTWQCGENSGVSKLTDDDVRKIRKLRSDGGSLSAIAGMFGVVRSTIYVICTRKAWKHVT